MRRVKTLCLLVLLSGPTTALALPEDANQPIRIQANSATLNERQSTAVYNGNVIITQGSMRLTGSRVTLNTDSDGQVSKIVSEGSPASYESTPRANQNPVKARSNTIEYHADTERVVLINNAFLEQDGNTFQGEYISYDINRQIVDAGRNGGTSGAEQPRIEITIQPRRRTDTSEPQP
ncbi:MAG: lipopolysaccharide transport periplasmic protein LptA [Gammaproteobacteria bacterium HGW-Gammaproteobacteria-11]|nr:MAG: lipopolysaccharide transport periplasmic protein LptA [Gammaproteobacteria bacterium HGW-Gammaproteobacteria-11]